MDLSGEPSIHRCDRGGRSDTVPRVIPDLLTPTGTADEALLDLELSE